MIICLSIDFTNDRHISGIKNPRMVVILFFNSELGRHRPFLDFYFILTHIFSVVLRLKLLAGHERIHVFHKPNFCRFSLRGNSATLMENIVFFWITHSAIDFLVSIDIFWRLQFHLQTETCPYPCRHAFPNFTVHLMQSLWNASNLNLIIRLRQFSTHMSNLESMFDQSSTVHKCFDFAHINQFFFFGKKNGLNNSLFHFNFHK